MYVEQSNTVISQEASSSWHQKGVRALSALALSIMVVGGPDSVQEDVSHIANYVSQAAVFNSNSTNWAGYEIAAPSNLDYVTADWIVPTASCPSSGHYDESTWAGLGLGSSSSDKLYQTGVAIECNNGTASYAGWWEVYPATPPMLNQPNYYTNTVSPGDKMLAEVVVSGSDVYLYLQDYGSNLANSSFRWNHATQIGESSTVHPSAAECIVEDPSDASTGNNVPFTNFGSTTFSTATSGSFNKACDVTSNNTDHIISSSSSLLNGLTGVNTYDIINSSNTGYLATTSGQSSDGAFTVTWQASS